jgi:glutaredoxin 3
MCGCWFLQKWSVRPKSCDHLAFWSVLKAKVSEMARVEVYTSAFCGYCARAKALLRDKGADFEEHDVTMDPVLRDQMIARAGGLRTVPQIFIGDRHIGGSDDLFALDRSGGLDPLLAA